MKQQLQVAAVSNYFGDILPTLCLENGLDCWLNRTYCPFKQAIIKIQSWFYSLGTAVALLSVYLWPDNQSQCCFWGSSIHFPPLQQRRGAAAVTVITVSWSQVWPLSTVNYTVHCQRSSLHRLLTAITIPPMYGYIQTVGFSE